MAKVAAKTTTKTAPAKPAATKAATKAAAKPKAAEPAALKPIKETLNKTGLIAHLVTHSGIEAKGVKKVLEALEGAIAS